MRLRFDPLTALVTTVLLPTCWLLFRLLARAIKKWATYSFEGMLWILSRTIMHRFSASISMRQYCRKQLGTERSKYLPVPGSDVLLRTDDIFVPLTLEYGGNREGKFSHRDLLNAGDRLRIVGDPGSGKSSLVKKLFRDACSEGLRKPRKSRLPVVVELKELEPPNDKAGEEALGKWALAELRRRVVETKGYKPEELFDSYAITTGLLVLLDGLDEVSSSAYDKMTNAIVGLSHELERLSSSNAVVLTMRTQFHRQISDHFTNDFPPTLYIRPFTPPEIYDFLSRWPFKDSPEDPITRIYSDLTDRPTLREMCSNPLVLSMYVANDQGSDPFDLPETRTEFYSKVTEELLVARRARQMGSTKARSVLREQREAILGKLALDHLSDPYEPANSLPWDRGLKVVADVLQTDDLDVAEQRFRELARETGLVTEERLGERFRFIHLTFCEFLAAKECTQRRQNGWSDLMRTQENFTAAEDPQLNSRLVEVIPFACALLPPVHRPSALTEVAALGNQQIIARCFLETKAYDHPSWLTFVKTEADFFSNSVESEWNEVWLRRLHLFNVVLRDAEDSARITARGDVSVTVESVFHRLVGKDEDKLLKLFSSYANQDAAAAFRLAQAVQVDLVAQRPDLIVENSAEPPFLALIITQSLDQPSRATLWSTILAEAGLRYRVVATRLNRLPSPQQWTTLLDSIPRRHRWLGTGKESFFLTCVTLAVCGNRHYKEAHEFPSVSILRNIKAGRWTLSSTRLVVSAILGLAITAVGLYLIVNNFRVNYTSSKAALAGFIGPFAIYFAGAAYFIAAVGRYALFQEILNLRRELSGSTPRSTLDNKTRFRVRRSLARVSDPSEILFALARLRYPAANRALMKLRKLRYSS
jgi:hypothetical protein